MIWFKSYTLDDIHQFEGDTTLARHIGIEFTALGPDYVVARMPVDGRTRQPYGVLHGGASVALAESLASVAAALCIDPAKFRVFGQEINANHIRSVTAGYVHGTARPLHIGRRSHVWEVRIVDGKDRLVCVSRMTAAVVEFSASA
jgi:1,4-dihydroxy-2-naphthoyl-CoA hydrolase